MLFSIHHLPSIASQAAEKLSGIRVTSPPSVTNLGAPFIQACGRLFRPGVGITGRFMRLRGPNKTNGACPSRRLVLSCSFFPAAVRLLATSYSAFHIPPQSFETAETHQAAHSQPEPSSRRSAPIRRRPSALLIPSQSVPVKALERLRPIRQ